MAHYIGWLPGTRTAQGETAPANPDDLRKNFFTKRKKDVIEFDYRDSGKTCWMAVQAENEGKKGLWGHLVMYLSAFAVENTNNVGGT